VVDLSLINKKHLWYIVGFIATDGSLSIDKRHISITSKDRSLLINIKKALNLKNKIGLKSSGSNNKKNYSNFQIGDKKFYNYLLNIGLMPNKSLKLKEIVTPDDYFVDFLRGVIDGDGNIQQWRHNSNGNMQWVLRIVSGSPLFLPWLQKKIKRIINADGRLHISRAREKRNALYVLKYGKFAAKTILRECYYKGSLALDRKLKIAIKCIQSKNGLSKYGKFISS